MNGIIAFDNPWVLWFFLVFVPLILYDHFSWRGKQIQQKLPKNLKRQLGASRVFFRIFLACLITAMAGPRWGMEPVALPGETFRAVDAVIALDVSRSMEALDGQAGGTGGLADISRLERGVSIVREAVTVAPGIRLGIAISRSRGIIAVPLTWDSDAVLTFLAAAGSSLTGRGTNLESLIDAAASAFQPSHPAAKVILLVSDGEALSGSLKAAVERCRRDGIAVIAIAVGSDEGRILEHTEILSRRDPWAMRSAAGQTGGGYIDGNRDDASRMIAGHLYSLAPGSETRRIQKEPKNRWFIFVMSGIIAFGASKWCLLRMGRRAQ